MSERKHNHYFRPCPYDDIDVYRIIEIFEITCPAAQHILKKVIATGKRGHKDLETDWQDIVDSAQRKIEMLKEDARSASLGAFNANPEELGENAIKASIIPTTGYAMYVKAREDYLHKLRNNQIVYPNLPGWTWNYRNPLTKFKPYTYGDDICVEVFTTLNRDGQEQWFSDPQPVSYWDWNSDNIIAYALPEDYYT